MRKAAFQELLMMKENNVLKASVLSGYPPEVHFTIDLDPNNQQPSAEIVAALIQQHYLKP